jgi:regulator of replication initiation timing
MEKQLVKVSMHREEERQFTNREIEEMRAELQAALEANEELLNENNHIKGINDSLANNI